MNGPKTRYDSVDPALISRINEMEARFDRVAQEPGNPGLAADLEALRDYMESGQWRKDFEADEAGKVPTYVKCGVLSEDGLYNLLESAGSLRALAKATPVDADLLRPKLKHRENDSHKGDYGHLLIVAGCERMPGAAVLATGAALRSGCGLVTLHSTPRTLQACVNSFPSAMLSEAGGDHFCGIPDGIDRYDAIAVGPGLGRHPDTATALRELIDSAKRNGIPMVLDADALNILASERDLLDNLPAGSVMTPHLGELRRLVSFTDDEDKEAAVLGLCRRTGSVVLVKGYRTRIYTPDVGCFENTTGNPGMAKGGSGDVLTGLVGGLMARGYSALDAATLGAWLHGYAGDALTKECTAEVYSSRELIDYLKTGFTELYLP